MRSDDVKSREPLALLPELSGRRVVLGHRVGLPLAAPVEVSAAHVIELGSCSDANMMSALPRKQTFAVHYPMSAKGQKRTSTACPHHAR